MRPSMRRSVRKCWPKRLSVGGNAPPPGGRERGTASAAQHDDGEVVAERRVSRVLRERLEHPLQNLGRWKLAMPGDDVEHRLFAEPRAHAVARVAHAVGE